MAVTFRHLFRQRITTQYPEEKLIPSKRFRGYELIWDKERCTGCATCARSCPQGEIVIVTSRGEGNKYVVDKFELDSGRCIFCGLCVEACPYDALFLGLAYERASYRRGELVLSKEQLERTPEKQISAYFHPEFEASLPQQTLLLERAGRKGQK